MDLVGVGKDIALRRVARWCRAAAVGHPHIAVRIIVEGARPANVVRGRLQAVHAVIAEGLLGNRQGVPRAGAALKHQRAVHLAVVFGLGIAVLIVVRAPADRVLNKQKLTGVVVEIVPERIGLQAAVEEITTRHRIAVTLKGRSAVRGILHLREIVGRPVGVALHLRDPVGSIIAGRHHVARRVGFAHQRPGQIIRIVKLVALIGGGLRAGRHPAQRIIAGVVGPGVIVTHKAEPPLAVQDFGIVTIADRRRAVGVDLAQQPVERIIPVSGHNVPRIGFGQRIAYRIIRVADRAALRIAGAGETA